MRPCSLTRIGHAGNGIVDGWGSRVVQSRPRGRARSTFGLRRLTRRVDAIVLTVVCTLGITLLGQGEVITSPLGVVSALAAARDTTGTPTGASKPAECRVAPRPVDDFLRVVGTPDQVFSGLLGTPVATPEPPTGGRLADAAVVAGVTGTASELVACLNAGDLPRVTALMTDRYFRQFFGGIAEENVATITGTPTPLPANQQGTLVAVEDVRRLDDGRVTAITQVNDARALSVFVKVGGRYLLDDSFALPKAGTPTP